MRLITYTADEASAMGVTIDLVNNKMIGYKVPGGTIAKCSKCHKTDRIDHVEGYYENEKNKRFHTYIALCTPCTVAKKI